MVRSMRHNERGAALLVAIGVLVVLLVIGLSFFQMSRQEMRTATNYANGVQAELMAEGAISIATAFLNQDKEAHPTYTSTDHAWKSYFNGTWAAGKPWAWARGNAGDPLPVVDGGPPLIDIERIERDLETFTGLPQEIEISDLGDGLYIPRVENDSTPFIPLLLENATIDAYMNTSTDIYNNYGGTTLPSYPFVTSIDLGTSGLTGANGLGIAGNVFIGENASGLPLVRRRRVARNLTADNTGILELSNNTALLPVEQIHFVSDVDNDGDGLNDSIWLPVASDRLFPDDGLDNDLDGLVDAEDLDGELGLFMYSGAADGIDNDGDGFIDNEEEVNHIHFTLPLDRMFQFLDNGPDGNPNTGDEVWMPIPTIVPSDLDYRPIVSGIPTDNVDYQLDFGFMWLDGVPYTNYINDPANFRGRDSDFNGVINDGVDSARFVMNRSARLSIQVNLTGTPDIEIPINFYHYTSLFTKILEQQNLGRQVRILGEPLSEIMGRMAIHITDEASKVNVNAAGGLTYVRNDIGNPLAQSFSEGVGSHEYNLRVLPSIGTTISDRMWTYRMGAQFGSNSVLSGGNALATGISAGGALNPITTPGFGNFANNAYDISFPGYGFVDDNGNALTLAMNGIDDDGDAVFYQHDQIDNNPLDTINLNFNGDGIDNNLDGFIDDGFDGVDEPGEGALVGTDEGLIPYDYNGDGFLEYATLEGLDEPGEYRRYRPYRNFVAENDQGVLDGIDGDFDGFIDNSIFELQDFNDDGNNDGDGDSNNQVRDEIGELGDGPYRTTQQIKKVSGIAQITFSLLDPFITAHSTDRNIRHRHGSDSLAWDTANLREPSGIKLDYNFATPQEIALSLVRDFAYDRSLPLFYNTIGGFEKSLVEAEAADPGLTVFDINDIDTFSLGLRQEDTSVFSRAPMLNLSIGTFPGDPIFYDTMQLEADAELRAYQLAVNVRDFTDTNHARSELTVKMDDLWMDTAFLPNAGLPFRFAHEIYYTQTGVEDIRINEIMVRPVRRVEAEANTVLQLGDVDYDVRLDPNLFGANDFDVRFRRMYDVFADMGRIDTIYRTYTTGTIELIDFADWHLDTPVNIDSPDALDNLSLMGLRTIYSVHQNYLPVIRQFGTGVDVVTITDRIPSLAQFSFSVSDQLPAGRYYLTVNTEIIDPDTNQRVNTAPDYGDFRYAMRIGPEDADILNLIAANIDNEGLDFDFLAQGLTSPAVLSRDVFSSTAGMAFMQAESVYRLYSGSSFQPFIPSPGFSVEIPDDPDLFLHVAIMRSKATNDDSPLAINYFEFSQEPDHEWVELVNINKDGPAVDLSNWTLRVEGEQPVEMRIPEGTFIAPGGFLLLGVNKFDLFQNADLTYRGGSTIFANSIFANGIGLARGDDGLISPTFTTNNVTVPPMFAIQNPIFSPEGTGANAEDYVDNDGNGFTDDFPNMPVGARVRSDDQTFSTVANFFESIRPNKPYDRIVQLDIPGLVNLDTAQEIGRLVLQGGFFPNYPERDGIDNDGDGILLARDGIDNDGDGIVDEGFNQDTLGLLEGVDEGRRYRHPVDLSGPISSSMPSGLFVPGGFGANGVVLSLDRDGDQNWDWQRDFNTLYTSPNDPPRWKEFVERRFFPGDNVIISLYESAAIYGLTENRVVDRITYTEQDVVNSSIDDILLTNGARVPLNPNYPTFWPNDTMGIDFYRSLERKHPAYNGDRFGTRNRFQATDGNYDDWADSTGRYQRRVLYNTTNRRWELDTSLSGVLDRFATAAGLYLSPDIAALTNHAYHGSPLRMNMSQRLIENPPVPGSRFNGAVPTQFTEEGQFQFAGLPGSTVDRQWPFTKTEVRNRAIVSPGDLLTLTHFDRYNEMQGDPDLLNATNNFLLDFSSPNQVIGTNLNGTDTEIYGDFQVNGILLGQTFGNATARDPNLTVNPAFPNAHTLFAKTSNFSSNLFGDALFMADHRDYSADPSDNLSNDLHAVIANTAAIDTLSLSVGTASVLPLTETTAPNLLDSKFLWINDVTAPIPVLTAPSRWSPVLLYPMANDSEQEFSINGGQGFYPTDNRASLAIQQLSNFGYPVVHLFTTPAEFAFGNNVGFRSTVPGGLHDIDRWPLERRAIAYASENRTSINSTIDLNDLVDGRAGNEALFIWDGNDGVENGEYDLYLAVNEDLSALININNNNPFPLFHVDNRGTTGNLDDDIHFGEWFVNAATRVNQSPNAVKLDVEVFTDKDGDGKVWNSSLLIPFDIRDMNRGTTNSFVSESFDALLNTSPDINGFINYGPVRIENNFLAIFIRNRSDRDIMTRVSRVVLAPRKKTPGRLNINTVATVNVNFDQFGQRFYNPLIGLPGIMPGYNEFTKRFNFASNSDPAPPPLIDVDPPIAFNPEVNFNHYTDEILNNNPPFFMESQSLRPAFNEQNPALHYRARKIATNRPEHPDGRYYEHITGLVRPTPVNIPIPGILNSGRTGNRQLIPIQNPIDPTLPPLVILESITGQRHTYPTILSDLFRDNIQDNDGDSDPENDNFDLPDGTLDDIDGFIENEEQPRFEETHERFRRIANMITTRSDVFEIRVTVQTGFVNDTNGDGIFNYRDDREFTVTAEKDARVIYER